MDEVICNGDNLRLEDCSRNSWGSNDCSHYEDIGIKCLGKCVGKYYESSGCILNKLYIKNDNIY